MFKTWINSAKECAYFDTMNPDRTSPAPTIIGYMLLVAWWEAKHACQAVVCKWKDHNWVCEDWGGPESGGMAGHCTRCGFGFSHTLY